MGIGDYIWPFDRKFSNIPCAREAGIAAILGGAGLGAVTLMLTNKGFMAYKVTGFAGIGILWVTFGLCRYDFFMQTRRAQEFKEAVNSGKIN